MNKIQKYFRIKYIYSWTLRSSRKTKAEKKIVFGKKSLNVQKLLSHWVQKQYQNKEIYEMVIEDVKGLLVKQLLPILGFSDWNLGLTIKLRYQVQFIHELP